jgi:phytoene dehydrogenase-like protein
MRERAAADAAQVVGSGPNGLTAAIVLARAGIPTTVFEAESTIGGGTRSGELTLPGVIHDLCSAAYPMAVCSPAFDEFSLTERGLEWIHSPAPLAHPFDDGTAVTLERSVYNTATQLGRDVQRYRKIVEPLVRQWPELLPNLVGPVLPPKLSAAMMRFGLLAPWPATVIAKNLFQEERARALFAGIAAHSVLPLGAIASAAVGWVLAIAGHAAGWPIARGGSQSIANTLAKYFRSLGGTIIPDRRIESLEELDARIRLLDVTPRQLLKIAGIVIPASYR